MHKNIARKALEAIPSIPLECGEIIFAEPWEARAFALAVHLNEQGLFTWSEWAERFGAALAANSVKGEPLSYYQVWLKNLEALMTEKKIADQKAIIKRMQEWEQAAARTPHGQAIELQAG